MGETVTVACKMPNGLILRVFDMVEVDEPVMGGGTRTVQIARQRADRVVLKGVAAPFGQPIALTGGYALTHNVPADFFAAWLEQNADHDAVRNGLIFAHGRAGHAQGQAREMQLQRSGLEPINPEGDVRSPKGIERGEKKAA